MGYKGYSSIEVCSVRVHCCTWLIPDCKVNATGSDISDKQQGIDSV